jgi:hypothetical protein
LTRLTKHDIIKYIKDKQNKKKREVMIMLSERTIDEIKNLIKEYGNYEKAYNNAIALNFNKSEKFVSVIRDNIIEVLKKISDKIEQGFYEYYGFDSYTSYSIVDNVRFQDEMIDYISDNQSDIDLDLPKIWVELIVNETFSDEMYIDDDILRIYE